MIKKESYNRLCLIGSIKNEETRKRYKNQIEQYKIATKLLEEHNHKCSKCGSDLVDRNTYLLWEPIDTFKNKYEVVCSKCIPKDYESISLAISTIEFGKKHPRFAHKIPKAESYLESAKATMNSKQGNTSYFAGRFMGLNKNANPNCETTFCYYCAKEIPFSKCYTIKPFRDSDENRLICKPCYDHTYRLFKDKSRDYFYLEMYKNDHLDFRTYVIKKFFRFYWLLIQKYESVYRHKLLNTKFSSYGIDLSTEYDEFEIMARIGEKYIPQALNHKKIETIKNPIDFSMYWDFNQIYFPHSVRDLYEEIINKAKIRNYHKDNELYDGEENEEDNYYGTTIFDTKTLSPEDELLHNELKEIAKELSEKVKSKLNDKYKKIYAYHREHLFDSNKQISDHFGGVKAGYSPSVISDAFKKIKEIEEELSEYYGYDIKQLFGKEEDIYTEELINTREQIIQEIKNELNQDYYKQVFDYAIENVDYNHYQIMKELNLSKEQVSAAKRAINTAHKKIIKKYK